MEQEFKVKSLGKAMRVLECFTIQNPEQGVTEIAQQLGYQKSTVHNILSTFHELGYVSRNPHTEKYYLGLKCLHFSYIINNHMGLRQIFLPYLSKIATAVNETCYMAIPYGDNVVYLESALPVGSGIPRSILGEQAPMHCTGLGKAMLAHLPQGQIEAYASSTLEKFTEFTITDKHLLMQTLEEIRCNGYAVDNMEHEYGIRCVAVPVFGADGRVVAAVSASGPSLRFDPGTISRDAIIIRDILQPLQNTL